MITPEEDAVNFVYDILNAQMGVGGSLRALGVKALVKNEPGSPHENYISVFFGGGSEQDTSGYATVNVIVYLCSQEVMMGATTNVLARFTERIQLCRQLLRMASANLNREMAIGPMDYPMEDTEPDEKKNYFFHSTITVPVYVGGGS